MNVASDGKRAQWAILGGKGHLARKCQHFLELTSGQRVDVFSRRTSPALDIHDTSTFHVLGASTGIINLTHSPAGPPLALVDQVLRDGKLFIECSSDPSVVSALAQHFAGHTLPGQLVLGAGLFTGVSNLLMADLHRQHPQCRSARLAVALTPFSGAGRGTVALMMSMLRASTSWYESGVVHRVDGLREGPRVSLSQGDVRPSLRMPAPEVDMLRSSRKFHDIEAVLCPQPRWLVRSFALLPARKPTWMSLALHAYLAFIRRFLFAWRATPVELFAQVDDKVTAFWSSLRVTDGMRSAALAAACIATLAHAEMRPGCWMVDECMSLGDVLQLMRAISPADAGTRLGGQRDATPRRKV